MKHFILTAMLVSASPVLAQDGGAVHEAGTGHEHNMQMIGMAPVSEPGQGAFAAIGEIVAALEADPSTDWSKVNIDALRAHLVDMDLVVTHAIVTNEDIDFGMRFRVTGAGNVVGSIQRMVGAHASVMESVEGWSYVAETTETGAVLEITVPKADAGRLQAIGFFGILTSGMHHQSHHWMMATGSNPHH